MTEDDIRAEYPDYYEREDSFFGSKNARLARASSKRIFFNGKVREATGPPLVILHPLPLSHTRTHP